MPAGLGGFAVLIREELNWSLFAGRGGIRRSEGGVSRESWRGSGEGRKGSKQGRAGPPWALYLSLLEGRPRGGCPG